MGPIGRSPDRISRRWGPDNIPGKDPPPPTQQPQTAPFLKSHPLPVPLPVGPHFGMTRHHECPVGPRKTGPARLPVPAEREQIRQTPRKDSNENKAVTISSYFLILRNGNKYARPIKRTATKMKAVTISLIFLIRRRGNKYAKPIERPPIKRKLELSALIFSSEEWEPLRRAKTKACNKKIAITTFSSGCV
jgi:hypothetical protein